MSALLLHSPAFSIQDCNHPSRSGPTYGDKPPQQYNGPPSPFEWMQNGSCSFYLALRATHPGEATAKKRTAKNNRRGAMSLSGVARRDPYIGECAAEALMAVDGATCVYGPAMMRFQMSTSSIVGYGGQRYLFFFLCSPVFPTEQETRSAKTRLYESLPVQTGFISLPDGPARRRPFLPPSESFCFDSFELYGGWNFKLRASAPSILTCKRRANSTS